uniref:Uncharacterized protein n=1 Tax=Parascaris equorum TaxID=6256 RepID=A0A914RTU8_PAREQ
MIRECGGDVLITVMVMPMKDSEREEELKKALVERFLRDDNLSNEDTARIFFSTIAEKTGLLDEVKDSTTDSEKLVEDAEEMIDDGDDESADKSRQTNDSGPENGELKRDVADCLKDISVAGESADKVDSMKQMAQSSGRSPEDSGTVAESGERKEESLFVLSKS